MECAERAFCVPVARDTSKTGNPREEIAMSILHRQAQRIYGARKRMHQRGALRRLADDEGAATAEYAIVTLAAVAFAGLLVAILRSAEVRSMLLDLVQRALTLGG